MLINGSKLDGFPILSIHMGMPIARVRKIIVNPHNLKILAFELNGPEVGGENGTILKVDDVREFSGIGMIIDSSDEFVNPGDVIKLDEVLKLNFELYGLKVETKKGSKLGKVLDFVVDTESFKILQIVVQRPPLKAFMDPELLISTKEIVEVNDYKIIIKDEEQTLKKRAVKEDFVPNFVNPFREPEFLKNEKEN